MPVEPTWQVDHWIKIVTAVLSLLTLIATAGTAVVVARLNHRHGKDMEDLKIKANTLARREERTQALRASQVTPFLDKLHNSIYLTKAVIVTAKSSSDLPFPTRVLRAMLLSDPRIGELTELNNNLPAERASVLMGIPGSSINDFTQKANDVLHKSLVLYNEIITCDMSLGAMTNLEKQHEEYATAAADLLVELLKFLRAPIDPDERWPDISAKNLANWIAAVVAAKSASIVPTPNPSWRALWAVPSANVAFDEAFNQLETALMTGVAGALQVLVERKASLTTGGLGYVVIIEFCAKDRLDDFVTILPKIKMQSKHLWMAETAPEEKVFS